MDHARRVYDSVLDLLPSEQNPTPLVRVNQLNPSRERFELRAKLEWYNPFGSVKDRAASELIRSLEDSGALTPGGERGVVEATSGNTGISLAAIAGVKGYRTRAIVPNKVPLEKKILLKLAGAELEVLNDALCPAPGMGEGSINQAKTYARAQSQRYAHANQYENRANVEAHVRTTGPEIWSQTQGRITHLFVSLGTCGTVTGCATYLKQRNPDVRVIAVQPTEGHDVPGLRNLAQLEVSKLYDPSLVDEILEIDFELAYARAAELARREGLFAGPSSGLIFEGARRVVERDFPASEASPDAPRGVGVMIFCDNVFKYMSSMAKHLPELAEGTTP
ncbi:MAG: cysteine synthase family protein [Phycisphaerales bacterium]|jgi:cysteine synthase B|nr:cysteine synthase family protein [Phycisphaerales bacterium]